MTTPRHAPVLLDRVVALLAPALEAPGSVYVDCTLGLGGHSEAVLERLPERPGHRHRPRPGRPADVERAARGATATASPPCTRCTTSSPEVRRLDSASTTSTPSSSTSASPRCSSTSASAASPTPRTHRSTCGWTRRPDGPRPSVLNTATAQELTRILREYGEEKFASKIAREVVRRRETTPFTTSADLVELLYATIPAPGAAYGRPPRQAHLPGAADGGQRRARRPAPRDPRLHRGDRRRRSRGRRVLPLARGPPGQAGLRRRHPARRAAGPAVRPRGRRAGPAPRHPRRRAGRRARDRREPPSSLRPPARRRARPPVPLPLPRGVAR